MKVGNPMAHRNIGSLSNPKTQTKEEKELELAHAIGNFITKTYRGFSSIQEYQEWHEKALFAIQKMEEAGIDYEAERLKLEEQKIKKAFTPVPLTTDVPHKYSAVTTRFSYKDRKAVKALKNNNAQSNTNESEYYTNYKSVGFGELRVNVVDGLLKISNANDSASGQFANGAIGIEDLAVTCLEGRIHIEEKPYTGKLTTYKKGQLQCNYYIEDGFIIGEHMQFS